MLSGIACMAMVTTAFANTGDEKKANDKKNLPIEKCCTRSASEGKQNWTATRCFSHEDPDIAKGGACALAQADADAAKENAIKAVKVQPNEITPPKP